jgi:hypothetical protein
MYWNFVAIDGIVKNQLYWGSEGAKWLVCPAQSIIVDEFYSETLLL